METRRCTMCKQTKPLDEFAMKPDGVYPPGRRYQCLPCWAEWEARCQESIRQQQDLGLWIERTRAEVGRGRIPFHVPRGGR